MTKKMLDIPIICVIVRSISIYFLLKMDNILT